MKHPISTILIAASATLMTTQSWSLDATSCSAKLGKDGAVLVSARGVQQVLLWGTQAGREDYELFNNAGTCAIGNTDPKNCELGAPGTPERISPPEGCTVYLKDTGDLSTCAAYVKKCILGRRPCPSDMVTVGGVCIDKYEASVWDAPQGITQYGTATDDYPCSHNGSNCGNIYALSKAGVQPSSRISWLQAMRACGNVGKRLPTNAEWQQAALGTPDVTVDNHTTTCVIDSVAEANTGSRSACVSAAGAFDMVGNVREWVADMGSSPEQCPGWAPSFSDDGLCIGANPDVTEAFAIGRGGGLHDQAAAGPLYLTTFSWDGGSALGFRCAR